MTDVGNPHLIGDHRVEDQVTQAGRYNNAHIRLVSRPSSKWMIAYLLCTFHET
jgi:hypothetical protein